MSGVSECVALGARYECGRHVYVLVRRLWAGYRGVGTTEAGCKQRGIPPGRGGCRKRRVKAIVEASVPCIILVVVVVVVEGCCILINNY